MDLGLAYGITDAGVTTLTVWRWGDDNRRRRIDVSVLNAGFTVGALLAPTLVVASLRFGVGRWAFYAIAGISLITAFLLGLQRPMPLPISPKDGRSSPKITRAADRLLIQTSHSGGHAARAQLSQRRYERGFILAMSIILICVTACEHGIATWLSPLGVESGGLTEQRMALITSFYWAVMCAGRLLWAAMSGCVSSTWPMLFSMLAHAYSLRSSLWVLNSCVLPSSLCSGSHRWRWGLVCHPRAVRLLPCA